MKITTIIAFVLILIGAIIWGLIGIFNINLLTLIFGAGMLVPRIVYTLVGISALWMIFVWAAYHPFRTVA